MAADGAVQPAAGTLTGVRAAVRAGRARRHARLRRLCDGTAFDSLLAKLIVRVAVRRFRRSRSRGRYGRWRSSGSRASRRTSRSCGRCCAMATSRRRAMHTRFVEEHLAAAARGRRHANAAAAAPAADVEPARRPGPRGRAIDTTDPLRCCITASHGGGAGRCDGRQTADDAGVAGGHGRACARRCRGRSSRSTCGPGDLVRRGAAALRHGSDEDGARRRGAGERHRRRTSQWRVGDAVFEGHLLALLEQAEVESEAEQRAGAVGPGRDPAGPGGGARAPRRRPRRGAARMRSRGGARPASARRARTSRSCAIRDRSSSTGRW